MYTNQPAATTATPQSEADKVTGLRNLILDLLHDALLVTAKEWETALQRTANCQNVATLQKWYRNTVIEIARREEAHAAPVVYATGEQKEEIIRLLNHPAVSRPRKTKELVGINRLTEAQAVALIADLTALTTTPPTRPAGAGLVVNRAGQLAVAALSCYVSKEAAAAGGVSVSYVKAA